MEVKVHGTDIKLDLDKAQYSGGKTGSARVIEGEDTYQYKPPIANNSFLRQLKSDFTDSENFGELLAAHIAKAFDSDALNPRVPTVSFVTSEASRHLAIASKYLGNTGEQLSDLDDFLKKPLEISHIKLVHGEGDPNIGHYGIDNNLTLKSELARAIALSALVGDHDVNPGNMIVIGDSESLRVGRIDYGHAFKDLMRHSNFGGEQTHPNNIIDFFNRATVDGLDDQSKLWRDYPGLIPSREMAEALLDVGTDYEATKQMQESIEAVKEEVIGFTNNPNLDINKIIRSFQRIAEHVSGEKIDSQLSETGKIEEIFKKLANYVQKNQKQMVYAANVMMLQVSIQEAVKNGEKMELLAVAYGHLEQEGHDNHDIGPFSWIKEDAKSPPFQGNFNEFVEHQKSIEKLNKFRVEIARFFNEQPAPSEDESAHVRGLQAIVNDPQKSVEEKILLLEDKVQTIDKDLKAKSGFFSKIINFLRNLFSPNLTLKEHINTAQKFHDFKSRLQNLVNPELGTPEPLRPTEPEVTRPRSMR